MFNWWLSDLKWDVPLDTCVEVSMEDLEYLDGVFFDYDTTDSFCYQLYLAERGE